MEACDQAFKSWRWSGPGQTNVTLFSNLSNPISRRVSMTSSSWARSSGAGHQLPNWSKDGRLRIYHPFNRKRLSLKVGFVEGHSAIAVRGSVTLEGASSPIRKEHDDQLEKYYEDNEYLFDDESWGALGNSDPWPPVWMEEQWTLAMAAGQIQRRVSPQVLVWGGSAAFVQQLCQNYNPTALVVTHFSLPVLAAIKETNDDVKCWHGSIEDLTHSSCGPFDCVFLNSVIATARSPRHLLQGVSSLCRPGARIVICYTHGKENLAVCRSKNPDLILHDLPGGTDLETMINSLPMALVELQDDPAFYLAALQVTEDVSKANTTALRSTFHQVLARYSELRFCVYGWHGLLSKTFIDELRFGIAEVSTCARGHILQGFGRGSKQLGIPTANIGPPELPTMIQELPKGSTLDGRNKPN